MSQQRKTGQIGHHKKDRNRIKSALNRTKSHKERTKRNTPLGREPAERILELLRTAQ